MKISFSGNCSGVNIFPKREEVGVYLVLVKVPYTKWAKFFLARCSEKDEAKPSPYSMSPFFDANR
ncbi:MAG: hypothetical protein ACI9LG_000013 [Moritella dasanensis]|jgi:hypothetical protein